jgi:hypothetical protein
MTTEARLATPLLTLRLGVFIVMLMWTLDKFVNPAHAGAVFENFYSIGGLGSAAFLAIGIAELIVIVAFVLGIKKTLTYGIVLALHTVSTLSSWQQYLGFDSLLFFAAWPMLAACYTLFVLRDLDTKLTMTNLA